MQLSAELLNGRSALVTGGSRGIGRAVAAALSGAGAQVTVVARGADALARCAQTLGVDSRVVDVADEAAVTSLAGSLPAVPDIVVHAAGALSRDGQVRLNGHVQLRARTARPHLVHMDLVQ